MRPDLVLAAATALWGASFLITRGAVHAGPPIAFVALRFLCAAVLVQLATRPNWREWQPAERRGGAAIGTAMVFGYGLLAIGLGHAPAGRMAFINALYVPGVPLLDAALRRAWPARRALLGATLASAGLMLMAGPLGGGGLGPADALALGAALATSAEVTLVGRFAPRAEPRRLAVLQCLCVAGLAALASLALGEAPPARPWAWAGGAASLGIASALLQLAANWGMRHVPAPRAVLIFAMEPVWAAGFGALAGERLSAAQVAGGALILGAMVVGGRAERTEAVVGG